MRATVRGDMVGGGGGRVDVGARTARIGVFEAHLGTLKHNFRSRCVCKGVEVHRSWFTT